MGHRWLVWHRDDVKSTGDRGHSHWWGLDEDSETWRKGYRWSCVRVNDPQRLVNWLDSELGLGFLITATGSRLESITPASISLPSPHWDIISIHYNLVSLKRLCGSLNVRAEQIWLEMCDQGPRDRYYHFGVASSISHSPMNEALILICHVPSPFPHKKSHCWGWSELTRWW